MGESGGKVEVVGNAKPNTFEEALGLDDARGREVAPMEHPALKKVLAEEDNGVTTDGVPVELVQRMTRLEEENKYLNSEKGRYGREVVGPLRKENEELQARISAIEAGLSASQQQAAAPQDPDQYARQLFGPHVDVEDPEVQRQTQLALTVLDAAERGTQSYVNPVMQELKQLRQDLTGTRDLAASGLSLEQVRQAEEANPELKELPDSSKFALIRRLMDAGKQGTPPARDGRGRFTAGGAPATASPEYFVEGGSGVSPAGSLMDEAGGDQKWSRRMQNFKALRQDQKAGGARAQTHVFLDMLRRGEFSGS
jgi:hypothetical protein